MTKIHDALFTFFIKKNSFFKILFTFCLELFLDLIFHFFYNKDP